MHRKVIVVSVVNRKLLFKIFKRVKRMCSIKIFVIFAVATLNLSVMSRCVGLYEFVFMPHCLRLASNSVGIGFSVLPNRFVNA